ncbi:MAG: hypothetical protein K2X82_22760 [Gemmataceae bacterium]|nr:hypothetical protein [Gemmataceae bacterium]
MTRSVLCPLAVLLAAGWSAGQPPKGDPPGKADPAPPPNRFPMNPLLREEVELLEAQLGTKEAYIRAAEVAVDGPKVRLARLAKLAQAGTVTEDEVEAVKVEVRLAEAQLAIRKAEANEVAVKLKHARGRLERAGKRAAVGPDLKRAADELKTLLEEGKVIRQAVEDKRARYEKLRRVYDQDHPELERAGAVLKALEVQAIANGVKAAALERKIEQARIDTEVGPEK